MPLMPATQRLAHVDSGSECEELKVRKRVCNTPMTRRFLAGARDFADGPIAVMAHLTTDL